MSEKIRVEVKGAATLPISKLVPFQGELKTLNRERYEELRANLIKNGISFTTHVWKHKGKYFIIDGHQRTWALNQMAKVEGFKIPQIPVSFVEAKNFKSAKLKVLAGVSQYGAISEKSLYNFLKENEIPFDEIISNSHFPELDMGKFLEMFNEGTEALPQPEESNLPEAMRSAGDGVRQVQLFFDAETHLEFMSKVNALGKLYGKENITDTLMEVVRAAHKSSSKKLERLVDAIP